MDLVFAELAARLARGQGCVLCTVVRTRGSTPRKAGSRMLVDAQGRVAAGTIGGGRIEFEIARQALEQLARGQSELLRHHLTRGLGMCCGGEMEVFVEPFAPAPRLVLFGGGHVAQALGPMAKALGFHLTVVDELEEYASAEKFPHADAFVHSFTPSDWKGLELGRLLDGEGAGAYLIIVTRNHRVDEDLLEALTTRAWAYLGMIGSRAKVARFRTRLEAKGVDPERLARVHMPIGLDIAAETPAEIAVAIAAQLVRTRRLLEQRQREGAAGDHDEGCVDPARAMEPAQAMEPVPGLSEEPR